jgi:hypothetical protein
MPCKTYYYPTYTPTIYSVASNINNTVLNINGSNFLPPACGTTFVNFGLFTNLPIIFYSSYNISFVIPIEAISGNHSITVVNVYNINLRNHSYAGTNNYSNSITYTKE